MDTVLVPFPPLMDLALPPFFLGSSNIFSPEQDFSPGLSSGIEFFTNFSDGDMKKMYKQAEWFYSFACKQPCSFLPSVQ